MKRSRGWKPSPEVPARRALLVLTLLALVVTLATACSSAPAPDATGAELYSDLCSACHGTQLEGKVGPALGPGAVSAALPDDYLANSIRRGIGTMPSFDHLSDDQVARLIAHIRDVQAGR